VGATLEPIKKSARTVPDLLVPGPFTFDYPGALRVGEGAPGHISRNSAQPRKAHQIVLAFLIGRGLPGTNRPRAERFGFVGYHQSVVDPDDTTEAATDLTRSQR